MKKKLKGLLSLWLAAALVLVAPTMPAMAEETGHGEHTDGWSEYTESAGNLEGNYYLKNDTWLDSDLTVNTGKSATICLNGKKLASNSGNVRSVKGGGTLTMDDCATTQGECSVPFEVSGGALHIKGGNYTGEATVKDCGVMNIQGGTYEGIITVQDDSTLNIGDENGGGTTKVWLDNDLSYSEYGQKIVGKFNLIEPQKNYITDANGKIKVFSDWYVRVEESSDKVVSKAAISAGNGYTVAGIQERYNELWDTNTKTSGSVYLYSDWVDGYTVTYDYRDDTTSNKTVAVVAGEAVTLENPTRTGYTFNGWKNSADNSNLNGGDKFTPTANTTLTAQWTSNSGGGSSSSTSSDNSSNNSSNDNTGTTDWSSVKNNVSNAKDGDTVNIDLSKDTTVPGDIFDSIKGKDVTLVLDLGNGMSWKINGKSITADKVGDINFSVSFDSKTIPVEVINKVSGERYTMKLSLAHNGPFGMEAVLAVNLDAKNAGLYANLFYYNPETNELEFVGSDIITDKGIAEFTFTHASDYAIIIDKVSMNPNTGIPSQGTDLTDNITKAVYRVITPGKTGGTVAYIRSTDSKATNITIPATVTIDGITYKVVSVAANAFKNNKVVERIVIEKNIGEIGANAFYGCENLKRIIIKTTKLTSKTIGSNAFKGIAGNVLITVRRNALDSYKKLLVASGVSNKDAVMSIPALGTELTDEKTKAVYRVTKAGRIGGTVTYIRSTDSKATDITIPATVTIDGITYKVTAVAENAFKNHKTVQKITVGKNVSTIGAKAFYGCKKLKSIIIKTSRLTSKTVGSDAFKGIANDVTIHVPAKKLDIYKKLFTKKGLGDQVVVK